MGSRLELQYELERILGNTHVYYQPPTNVLIEYPAIIYTGSPYNTVSADNQLYLINKPYEIILIHRDPDNTIVDDIIKLPYCRFINKYVSDNLYHYVFKLYY